MRPTGETTTRLAHRESRLHRLGSWCAQGVLVSGVLATLTYTILLGTRSALHETAWGILITSVFWFPLAAIARRRLEAMRHEAWEFRARVGEDRRPTRPLLRLARRLRDDAWLRGGATFVSATAGALLVWRIHLVWDVAAYYPWPVLSLLIGASGGILLAELVGYGITAFAVYHDDCIPPLPEHPDGYGGWGQLAEQGNSLIAWLFVLVLVGNFYYLTGNQAMERMMEAADESGAVFVAPVRFGVTWFELTMFLSLLSTGIVLLAYLVIWQRLYNRLATNRRRCVAEADEAWRRLLGDAEARASDAAQRTITRTVVKEGVEDGGRLTETDTTTRTRVDPPALDASLAAAVARLKAAEVMQVSPAGVLKSIQLGALATAAFTAFVTGLLALLGQNAGELVQVFLPPAVNETTRAMGKP